MNYYTTFTADNTIACRHNGTEIEVSGCGTYVGKPAIIEVLQERDGFVLQKHPNSSTGKVLYKLLWDGECISRFDNEKEARMMFEDFAPAPKKSRKTKKAA